MAYVKILYQDSPSTATPMNAQNLNHMDDQIALNDQRLTEIETSYVKSFNGRKGEVVPENGDYDIGQIAPLTGAQVGQVPVVVNVGTEEDPELVFEMGAGGGGGHSIIDSEGNTMPQETAMQFPDSFVSDDNVNGRTVVENIKECQSTDLASMGDGIIITTDEEDIPIGEIEKDYVEVTADGVKTLDILLGELYTNTDFSKIRENSFITINISGRKFIYLADDLDIPHNSATFIWSDVYSHAALISSSLEVSANPIAEQIYNGTYSDVSNTKYANGTKIILYYGSSVATVNLQTDARHCMMSDGETSVESLLDSNVAIWNGAVANVTASNAVTMIKPDGTEVSSVYTGMIILQTSTSQANTGSVYMVRSGYTTPVCEGASAQAPRLVIEDSVIKVKLNSDTTGRGVRYTVIKYPS